MKDARLASGDKDRAERLDRLIPSGSPFGMRSAIDDSRQDDVEAQDLRPLVQLASDLRRSFPEASVAPAGRRVWARLAPRLESARPSRRPAWRHVLRPAYVLASLAVVFALGLGTTTAFAAEAALPGDALYPLKRGVEKARLVFSITPGADARLVSSFADRRLAEVEALIALERWVDVETALAAYPEAIDDLTDLDPTQAEAQLSRHLEVLERVRSGAPASAQAGLERALDHAANGRRQVRDRQTEHPRPETPGQERRESATATELGERIHPTPRRPGGLPPGWEKKETPAP